MHVYLCFVLFLARCATEAEPPEEEAALPSVTGNGLRCAGAEWEGVGRRDGCRDGYESHELCALLHSGWLHLSDSLVHFIIYCVQGF